MFSAILSGIGLLQSNSRANRAAADQRAAQQQQAEMQAKQYELALQELGMKREEQEYQRAMEAFNRTIMSNERDFREQNLSEYKEQLLAERMEGVNRQIMEDRAAARFREFQISQLLRNQQISGEERSRAIAEMEEAQAIARGERDEERREYLERKATAQVEQQFRMDTFQDAQRTAQSERAFELEQLLQNQQISASERREALDMLAEAKALAGFESERDYQNFLSAQQTRQAERDYGLGIFEDARGVAAQERQDIVTQRGNIMRAIDGLRSGLRSTQAGLQDIPDVQVLTEGDIRSEIDRRTTENLSDVDRAAERVASVNEADLMRVGMDVSDLAKQRRGDIASRLSEEYNNARNRAYDEALQYITGRQGLYANDINQIANNRSAMLGEEASIGQAGIQSMIGLPNAPSANSALNFYSSVPSGSYDRAISSAGNFSSPLNVNSAIYNDNIGSANSAMGYMPTGTANIGFGISSAGGNRDFRGIGSSIYDSINVGTGLAGYLNPRSAATTSGLTLGSEVMSPYNLNFDPASYFSNSQAIGTNILSGANTAYNNAMNNSAMAGSQFGSSLNDWYMDGGDEYINNALYGENKLFDDDHWSKGFFVNMDNNSPSLRER